MKRRISDFKFGRGWQSTAGSGELPGLEPRRVAACLTAQSALSRCGPSLQPRPAGAARFPQSLSAARVYCHRDPTHWHSPACHHLPLTERLPQPLRLAAAGPPSLAVQVARVSQVTQPPRPARLTRVATVRPTHSSHPLRPKVTWHLPRPESESLAPA